MDTGHGAPNSPADPDLATEIAALRQEVQRLNDHRFIRVQNSWARLLGFQILRGLALGFGTVLGASVLVSVVAYFLSQIDFIPIVGEWAAQLADQIQTQIGDTTTDGPPTQAAPDGSLVPNGD